MQRPRLRFSLRDMMIAVALTPIVLYAGSWAGMRWATTAIVFSTPPVTLSTPPVHFSAPPDLVDGKGISSVQTTTIEWTETVISDFSTGAALLAMAATTALLAAVWVLLARSFGRPKRA